MAHQGSNGAARPPCIPPSTLIFRRRGHLGKSSCPRLSSPHGDCRLPCGRHRTPSRAPERMVLGPLRHGPSGPAISQEEAARPVVVSERVFGSCGWSCLKDSSTHTGGCHGRPVHSVSPSSGPLPRADNRLSIMPGDGLRIPDTLPKNTMSPSWCVMFEMATTTFLIRDKCGLATDSTRSRVPSVWRRTISADCPCQLADRCERGTGGRWTCLAGARLPVRPVPGVERREHRGRWRLSR